MSRGTPEFIVSPNRLFLAADVLLKAIDSVPGFDTKLPMYTDSARRSGTRSPDVFTCEEFIEAMAMLIRMGLVPPPAGKNRVGRTSTNTWRGRPGL